LENDGNSAIRFIERSVHVRRSYFSPVFLYAAAGRARLDYSGGVGPQHGAVSSGLLPRFILDLRVVGVEAQTPEEYQKARRVMPVFFFIASVVIFAGITEMIGAGKWTYLGLIGLSFVLALRAQMRREKI
jgi:hypothetical protein